MPRPGQKRYAIDYWESSSPASNADPDMSDYGDDLPELERRRDRIMAAGTRFRSCVRYTREPNHRPPVYDWYPLDDEAVPLQGE